MPDWLQPALGPLGLLIGAVITFFGVRYSARSASRAAAKTADVASRQVDVGEWQAIVEALRAEVGRLTDLAGSLTERVGRLEDERRDERADTRQLLAFARGLIAIVYRLAPEHPIPTPPAAFVDELAYITTERPRA